MTTANKLTLCRVVMIPIFIVLLYQDFTHHLLAALGVFILASITDFVDGYVARHYNQVTDFGKFMDPLADKLLVMSAMAWFVQAGWMAPGPSSSSSPGSWPSPACAWWPWSRAASSPLPSPAR